MTGWKVVESPFRPTDIPDPNDTVGRALFCKNMNDIARYVKDLEQAKKESRLRNSGQRGGNNYYTPNSNDGFSNRKRSRSSSVNHDSVNNRNNIYSTSRGDNFHKKFRR